MSVTNDELLGWLLETDPALRWQVERDLVHAPEATWQATRARVATEGFGARLLALQDEDGQWAGGAYFPAGFDFGNAEADDGGQPYTATTWSLNALREWGLRMIIVSRCLERIGDHAVDIGEQTAYLVSGEFRESTDASHGPGTTPRDL